MHEKALVKMVLEDPLGRDWSLQGFGMLRLYLTEQDRLHVWSNEHRQEDVSDVHTHPWDFDSLVVAGYVSNVRFIEAEGSSHLKQLLRCGQGGGVEGEPTPVQLVPDHPEWVHEGDTYHQDGDEIHLSMPADGTVTIVRRTFREDTEHAYVYWPANREWVTAEPRPATPGEVRDITVKALENWF